MREEITASRFKSSEGGKEQEFSKN